MGCSPWGCKDLDTTEHTHNRQHIVGVCVLIHLACLCLLIGEFYPYTFKVITDRKELTVAIC